MGEKKYLTFWNRCGLQCGSQPQIRELYIMRRDIVVRGLSLDIIATFKDSPQEFYKLKKVDTSLLMSEEGLLSGIKDIISFDRDPSTLCKLSLCWNTKNDQLVKDLKVINDSINKRWGKYYFQNGELINV